MKLRWWPVVFFLVFVGVAVAVYKLSRETSQTWTEPQASKIPFAQKILTKPSPLPSPLPPLPQIKLISGGVQTFQTFNNCGPASLSMALSLYDIRESQQTLGQRLRPYQNPPGDNDDKSVTLDELASLADEYGFIAYHRPAGNVELLQHFIAQDIPVITRTWLKPGEDIGHYRVVKGYDRTTREFIQDDSLQGGNLRYSYEAFDELWRDFSYEFLVLVPPEKKEMAERILGELLDEETAWKKALDLTENSVEQYAVFNRSVALYHLGEYEDSIAAFEQVQAQLPPRMLWYQIEPILSYYQAGEDQKVMELSSQILHKHNRAFSELHYLQGKIYEKRGESESAAAAFARAEQYNSSGSWRVNVEG